MNSSRKFRAACLQMCSGLDVEVNIAAALEMIDQALALSANLIMTPEMTNIIDPKRSRLIQKVTCQDDDPAVAAFAGKAKQSGAYILAGSFALQNCSGGLVNRSLLFAPDGTVAAVYDKMHMFDVELPNGERYRESSTYTPGNRAVTADTSLGRLGLSVCYDLRFAALYRTLAQAGAEYLTIPSAFTRPTGEAHWEVLLRARAIETGCYVFAPAQTGEHESGRKTYGRSTIISPWGKVLADAGSEPGLIVAEIDPAQVLAARGKIPALKHDRNFSGPVNALHAKIAS